MIKNNRYFSLVMRTWSDKQKTKKFLKIESCFCSSFLPIRNRNVMHGCSMSQWIEISQITTWILTTKIGILRNHHHVNYLPPLESESWFRCFYILLAVGVILIHLLKNPVKTELCSRTFVLCFLKIKHVHLQLITCYVTRRPVGGDCGENPQSMLRELQQWCGFVAFVQRMYSGTIGKSNLPFNNNKFCSQNFSGLSSAEYLSRTS